MNYFNKTKEFFKNPKNKSLTLLGIYAIFFVFVFAVTSSGTSSTPNYSNENKENIEKQKIIDTISNYEYIYKINNNEVINEIIGTYNNNEDTFNYNGINYLKKDGIIYMNNAPVENLGFDVDKYKYNKIELLIENSDSKTMYQDSKKIVYTMNINEYFTLLNEVNNCTNIDCNSIEVPITVESNEYINHVLIDLSNYYGYKYNIEINYNNINKISTN